MPKKVKNPLKVIYLSLPPWSWEGAVLAGGTPEDFKTFTKKYIDVEVNAGENCAGHAYIENGAPWLIWVNNIKSIPTLAHECLHITFGVLQERGMVYSVEGEEAYTYTMGYLLHEILKGQKWEVVK